MRSKGTRTIRPVDEDHQVTDHPSRAGLEALMDQKLFLQRIKSERSAAYWFAASLWGVTGLVLGATLGVFLTIMVLDQSEGRIRDNIVSGLAIDEARDTVNRRPSLLPGEDQPAPQNP
jgi:hypothetical protein